MPAQISEKTYVMTHKDQLAAMDVRRALHKLGACILDPSEIIRLGGPPCLPDGNLLVAITTVTFGTQLKDHHAGKHVRVSSSFEEALGRGFRIPKELLQAVGAIDPLPVLAIRLTSLGSRGLEEAITSFHHRQYSDGRLGKWLLSKPGSPSRQLRTELWKRGTTPAKIERRQHYAL